MAYDAVDGLCGMVEGFWHAAMMAPAANVQEFEV
jgi:hypothetical protein